MTKMWKPTKLGTYLLHKEIKTLWVGANGELKHFMGCAGRDLADGPWSLLAPEWQPGAPTVAQLERWQWWALQYDDCLVVGTTLADEDFDTVECSAPVQFDLSNGPLWVPLEVCNG